MKIPPEPERSECLRIRKLSKSGKGESSLKEHLFCRKMFKEYPAWYKETEEEVFNDTVPFGSNVRYKK